MDHNKYKIELEEEIAWVLSKSLTLEEAEGELTELKYLYSRSNYTKVDGYDEAIKKILNAIGHANVLKYPGCIDFKEQHKPDETVQHLTFSHGMKFWNQSSRTLTDILHDIPLINNIEGEICATQQCKHLGPIGVYVKGIVTFGAIHDIGSVLGPNGIRLFHPCKDIIMTATEIKGEEAYNYHEFHIKEPKVTGIWVKQDTYVSKWASQAGPKLQELATRMGIIYDVIPEDKH